MPGQWSLFDLHQSRQVPRLLESIKQAPLDMISPYRCGLHKIYNIFLDYQIIFRFSIDNLESSALTPQT